MNWISCVEYNIETAVGVVEYQYYNEFENRSKVIESDKPS